MTKIYNFNEFIFEAKKQAKMKEEMPKGKAPKKKPMGKPSKKKVDQDGDGDSDFADAKTAQYIAGGINKSSAIAMSRKFNK